VPREKSGSLLPCFYRRFKNMVSKISLRQETRELNKIISNFDEVKAVLSGTPWLDFLD